MTRGVTVVDYGLGNIHSVSKAFVHLGATVTLSADADAIRAAELLVLPGVGAFADGMQGLTSRGLVEPLRDFVRSGRPFLGICLGMQLLFTESEEFGLHRGLDLIPGRVVSIPRTPGLKVPQIGWNRITPGPAADWSRSPLAAVEPGSMLYFVHSFTAQPTRGEDRLADCFYGGHQVSAAIQRDNVVAFQFHPEKSGPTGLSVLSGFLRQ